MSWTVFFPGRWPGYNELNHNTGHYRATARIKKQWVNGAVLLLKVARIPPQKCVRLLYVHHRTNRRWDKGNLAGAASKILEDSLVQAGVIPDDGWNFIESFEHRFAISPREGVELTVIAA